VIYIYVQAHTRGFLDLTAIYIQDLTQYVGVNYKVATNLIDLLA